MEMSETIASLAGALSKAQAKIEGAKKDSNNPHFKSKYADLASVWDACREALTSEGLSIAQMPGACASGQMEMTTMLMHSSGEWIRETLTIPLQKVDAQGYGSATTYARRYSLAAMVGVAPDDDDGNAASAPNGADNNAPRQQQATQRQNIVNITPEHELMLVDKMREAGVGDGWLKERNYAKASDVPESKFQAAMKALNDIIASKQPIDDEIPY